MKLALADVDEDGLQQTLKEVSSIIDAAKDQSCPVDAANPDPPNVLAHLVDVADLDAVIKFKEKVFETWDEVYHYLCLLQMCSFTDMLVLIGRSLDEQRWYRRMERPEGNILGEQGCLEKGPRHQRCGVHVPFSPRSSVT